MPDWLNRRPRWQLAILGLLIFTAIFLAGFELGKARITKGSIFNLSIIKRDNGQPSGVDFSLFWQVWQRVVESFPENIDSQQAVYGAIAGAVRSLGDPYSDFFTPEETKLFEEEISGNFEGVGIEIGERDDRVVVIAPLHASPAERAGIRAGDEIVQVDERKIEGLSLAQIVKLIRGKTGSEVRLFVRRQGEVAPREFLLRREKITVKSLNLEDRRTPAGKSVSYLKLSQFSETTDEEFQNGVSSLLVKAPQAIILDLRNNPGGFFDGAVEVASYFTDGKPIAREVDKSGKTINRDPTKNPKLKNIPLLVLVNQGSASASEIVAGAIQDYHAGVLLGEKTFGKGTVQSFERLRDGSSLKITVGKWLTGAGREINKVGISPDREVKDDPNTPADEVLDEALKALDG